MDTKTYVDLQGFWFADFDQNGLELMEIMEEGDKFVAVKVTGDANVPGGQISFIIDNHTLVGEIQVAEKGFTNHQWFPGKVDDLKMNSFVFSWSDLMRTFTVNRCFTRIPVSPPSSHMYTKQSYPPPSQHIPVHEHTRYQWGANDPVYFFTHPS